MGNGGRSDAVSYVGCYAICYGERYGFCYGKHYGLCYLIYTIEKMKKIGTGVTTVRIKNPPLKSMITEQMKPYMPSKNLIKSTIESVSNYYTKKDKSFSDLCERISKYYAENINAYSKQSIIESLKVLHSKINDYLRKNNLQENNHKKHLLKLHHNLFLRFRL